MLTFCKRCLRTLLANVSPYAAASYTLYRRGASVLIRLLLRPVSCRKCIGSVFRMLLRCVHFASASVLVPYAATPMAIVHRARSVCCRGIACYAVGASVRSHIPIDVTYFVGYWLGPYAASTCRSASVLTCMLPGRFARVLLVTIRRIVGATAPMPFKLRMASRLGRLFCH